MSLYAFAPLDAKTYTPHELHGQGRTWVESNCYIDVWVEILHALGLDPYACLPHVLPVDFDGDQWTFFKPSHDDLFALYGIEVCELNVWRPLIENVQSQLSVRHLVLTEADAFFLPDTAGTDYRKQHTKTTIGIQALNLADRTLGYFHNSGYHRLSGDDFAGVFGLDATPDPARLPFFAEFVRIGRRRTRESSELTRESLRTLRNHLDRRPRANPVTRFRERFGEDLAWMQREGLAAYHAWAFATLRQLGAAFELGGLYVQWLERHGEVGLSAAAEAFASISATAKTLILKTARAVSANRALDAAVALRDAEQAWDTGMSLLAQRYGG